ncbi:helix-turn-helix domain-containing protein [Achromobacter phage Mano]|uniref:Helix-turn-helix domain-containing protein n=1 Tax=Achromobacter phage Mano TaxID=2767570 RepID=A0A7L8G8I1_9CAUD|nr:helix-turn-helix domain-containing protein [Achromobacter phage Mano]QOE32768.1 helix-turn-helix domain-containing protein [Achromobacter phage Mano]
MLYSREIILARVTISMVRTVVAEILKDERFGTRADDAVLCCAIFVGQAEHKPMTAAKLAEYAGIPRPTVVRKLRQLQVEGIVRVLDGGQAELVADLLADGLQAATARSIRVINTAASRLSKMDTHRIAHRKGV